jgi:Skp family chaperone for outer membrane proteins
VISAIFRKPSAPASKASAPVAALLLSAAAVSFLVAAPGAGRAQTPGWFVPQAAQPPAAPATTHGRLPRGQHAAPAAVPDVLPPPPPPEDQGAGGAEMTDAEIRQQAANLPQPPAPPLPDIVSTFYSETATGDAVKVTATGVNAALPAPLTADSTYYIIKGAQNGVQLAASAADASAGTAIALENAGAGTLRLVAPLIHTGQKNVTNDFTVALPNQLKLLPGGMAPPAPLVGVLGVPDVMRASSAAQAVDKVIGARKERLQAEVQQAQARWQAMKQQLETDAPHLTRDVGVARERQLYDRVKTEQNQLREKNRIIQEAAQVALGQIERTLIGIIRQVAEARGMNLVLHRSQVALNVQEYDITEAVTEQLNRALPTVQIPPDNVDPATLPKDWGSVTPVAAH